MSISKVISGGQTGADVAGLVAGKRFGLETGGWMPKGFKTQVGSRPDRAILYGVKEHESSDYAPRTELNAKESDATVRFAGNFSSRGEMLTLRMIKKYSKPYFDVDLSDPPPVEEFTSWLNKENVKVLNVAGNSEETYLGAFEKTVGYLTEVFFSLGLSMIVSRQELLSCLGIDATKVVTTSNGDLVLGLKIQNALNGRQASRMTPEMDHGRSGERSD